MKTHISTYLPCISEDNVEYKAEPGEGYSDKSCNGVDGDQN